MSHIPSNLTICGSGNAGHALAVVASANFEGDIDWLVGSRQRAEQLREAMTSGRLHSTGAITASADRVRSISDDPAAVIPGAAIILIVVPAFAHAGVLRRIGPFIGADTAVGCIPTRGGFEFESAHLTAGILGKRPIVFGLQTLPWSTRITSLGKIVNIGAVKKEVVLAALPASEAPHIAAALSTILATRVVTTDAFVGLTLANPGQFIHTGLMYGHFRSWRGEEYDADAIPMLYAEATDEMGDLVDQLSQESIAVAAAIESRSAGRLKPRHILPVHDWLVKVYGDVTADTSTVGSCFRTGPIQGRKAPMLEVSRGKFVPNFEYRYLSEDIPFGLVMTRALAGIVHVATPVIDEVIAWAQSVLQKTYLVGDSLVGPDAKELPLPQNQGICSLSDLLAWYHDRGASDVAATPMSARW